jgi:FAD/FMN-containing dehydrogenase
MDDYVRGFRAALKPWCGEAAYVNYQDAAIRDYGQAYWGRNYRRLREVKRRVDPREHFTFPQAVRP